MAIMLVSRPRTSKFTGIIRYPMKSNDLFIQHVLLFKGNHVIVRKLCHIRKIIKEITNRECLLYYYISD